MSLPTSPSSALSHLRPCRTQGTRGAHCAPSRGAKAASSSQQPSPLGSSPGGSDGGAAGILCTVRLLPLSDRKRRLYPQSVFSFTLSSQFGSCKRTFSWGLLYQSVFCEAKAQQRDSLQLSSVRRTEAPWTRAVRAVGCSPPMLCSLGRGGQSTPHGHCCCFLSVLGFPPDSGTGNTGLTLQNVHRDRQTQVLRGAEV